MALVNPVLFLGAGASKQFGLPTLKDLTREIIKKFPRYSDDLKKIQATLRQYHFNDNIEGILSVLKAWTKPKIAFKQSDPFITQVIKFKLLRDLHVVRKYKRWVNNIENYIHKRCKVEDLATIHRICDFYDEFWDALIRKYNLTNCSTTNCPYIDVFTTNYDNVIEEYCYERGVELCTGYREFAGGRLSFYPDSFSDADNQVRLYKLHGSVDLFKLESGDIVRLNSLPNMNTRIHGRRIIERMLIYPVSSKHYFLEPYLEFLTLLKRKLVETKDCIVVGYSFGDKSIKSIFSDAAKKNKQLRIILVSLNAERVKKEQLEEIMAEIIPTSVAFEEFEVLGIED